MKEITNEPRPNGTFIIYQDFGNGRKVYTTLAQINPDKSLYRNIAYREALKEFSNFVADSVVTGAEVKLMFGEWSEEDLALVNVQTVEIK